MCVTPCMNESNLSFIKKKTAQSKKKEAEREEQKEREFIQLRVRKVTHSMIINVLYKKEENNRMYVRYKTLLGKGQREKA